MKKLTIAFLLVALAVAFGYVLGTESGRRRRDVLVARFRPGAAPDGGDELVLELSEVPEEPAPSPLG